MQAVLQPIREDIAEMKTAMAILCARQDNTVARTFNRAETFLLRPLVRGYKNPGVVPIRNPGDLPQFFPANRTVAINLTNHQLGHLEDFYNVLFAGDTVAERRTAFLNFITLV